MTDPLLTAVHIAAVRGTSLAAQLVLLHGGLRRQWEWMEAAPGRINAHDLARDMSDSRIRDVLVAELADVVEHADFRGRGHAGASGTGPALSHARARLEFAMRIADPRVETALESISWARFQEWGLDAPVPQARLRGASGVLWRVDFLFEGRVIAECDGAVKYRDGYTSWEEKRRQSDLEAEGYVFVRWTWEELLRHPDRVLARIAQALARSR